jgi:hypothetical protein
MPRRAAILDLFLTEKNRRTGDDPEDRCVDVTQLGGREDPSVGIRNTPERLAGTVGPGLHPTVLRTIFTSKKSNKLGGLFGY